jgi:hypothetical protein
MRTTITIDDDLLEQLKRRAAERGTTVSRLIEDSVRLAAARPRAAEAEDFKLVTFGRGGRFTGLDVNKTAALLEPEDVERYGRRKG